GFHSAAAAGCSTNCAVRVLCSAWLRVRAATAQFRAGAQDPAADPASQLGSCPRNSHRYMNTPWPELSYPAGRDTLATLHLWTQIVGKIRLAQTPWLNHSWHVPLYLTSRGLTTSPIPHRA